MIVTGKRSWFRLLFALRGSSLRQTWPRIATVTAFAALLTLIESQTAANVPTLTMIPFSLVGVALSIFLGFRNNESYDRFWEGRKLWGAMVNVSRSFARQTRVLISNPKGVAEDDEIFTLQRDLVRMTIGYVQAFCHHLRGTNSSAELEKYLSPEDKAFAEKHTNVPIAILQRIGMRIHHAWKQGLIHDLHLPVLEASLTEMTAVQGGCERIKGTPIPFAYSVLIHRIVAVYCLSLPFGLLDSVGVFTPIVVFMISYAFFGLDAIGDEVEQPFDTDENDLPISAISRTIEIDLLQSIGDFDGPAPAQPTEGVLL